LQLLLLLPTRNSLTRSGEAILERPKALWCQTILMVKLQVVAENNDEEPVIREWWP
jgi:hypothetical protein